MLGLFMLFLYMLQSLFLCGSIIGEPYLPSFICAEYRCYNQSGAIGYECCHGHFMVRFVLGPLKPSGFSILCCEKRNGLRSGTPRALSYTKINAT